MQLLDPNYAAAAFFGGPQGPNGGSPMGLIDHKGWESMPKGEAAQDVQVSAFPDKYGYWEAAATDLLTVVQGYSPSSQPCAGIAGNGVGGYTVGTLNVLGHSHTKPGGNKYGKWPQAPSRMRDALEVLDSKSASVVGVQEFEHVQWQVVKDSDDWGVYPETTGYDPRNGVIWRKDQWTLVQGKQFKIPYFGGNMVAQSYVRLRNNASGEEIYFISVHNPANVRGPAEHHRAKALEIEETLVKSLEAEGLPVFLVGDFNDREDVYCALGDTMTNAQGKGTLSPCRGPARLGIDQIYVAGETTFASYQIDRTLKPNGIADHPLLTATVASSSTGANGAIDFALQQVGKGYSQAAHLRMGPTHFDCSGLVHQAFKKVGITLGTYTGTQQKDGQEISSGDLQPGDLIFYYAPISHVAIYLGQHNGVESIVHAANPRDGVEVSPRSEMRSKEVMYRRVL